MKRKIINIFILSVFLFGLSCNKSEDPMTKDAKEGGLLEVASSALMYVVGDDGPYTFNLFVNQPDNVGIRTNWIHIYKSFFSNDSANGGWSNEVLTQIIEVTNGESHYVNTLEYSFANLIDGLTINGTPLPGTDAEMNIGDYWSFRIVAQLDNGELFEQAYQVRLTVSTRYAGSYKCVAGEYYRLGVLTYGTADWPNTTVIESVDAITYRVADYWGPFDGNELFFQIDANGVITYPAAWEGVDQTGNGMPLITCQTNPGDMTEVHCGESNFVQNDDVNGKDKLYMSFGYYTSGSGPRIFYQVLEKIVE